MALSFRKNQQHAVAGKNVETAREHRLVPGRINSRIAFPEDRDRALQSQRQLQFGIVEQTAAGEWSDRAWDCRLDDDSIDEGVAMVRTQQYRTGSRQMAEPQDFHPPIKDMYRQPGESAYKVKA